MVLRTAVAVSGGVDSLVAADLLRQQGHDVFGIHFIHGYENSPEDADALADEIGRQVGIRVDIVDCRQEFKTGVIDYFTETYRRGLTPNPCMVCNFRIKFGTLLTAAQRHGAHRLATGHYARIRMDPDGTHALFRGTDRKKEQSYFLAFLDQKQLGAARFPLGDLTKAAVRRLAAERGLRPAVEKESQDVCFIRSGAYDDFICSQSGFVPTPGHIEDVGGRIIGKHGGLHGFTVGQRKGINCPAAEPYYVLRLDRQRNRLVVGFKSDLQTERCTVSDINWIGSPPTGPIPVTVQIRYRSAAVRAMVEPTTERSAIVRFWRPQTAVTPGQAAVFYKDQRVMGGGWIRLESKEP